jgi:hypothetical protein
MKKAWRLRDFCGSTYVTLFSENGKILDTYKCYSRMFGKAIPRPFTFKEYDNGLPQKIALELNNRLKNSGDFTEFIEKKIRRTKL